MPIVHLLLQQLVEVDVHGACEQQEAEHAVEQRLVELDLPATMPRAISTPRSWPKLAEQRPASSENSSEMTMMPIVVGSFSVRWLT